MTPAPARYGTPAPTTPHQYGQPAPASQQPYVQQTAPTQQYAPAQQQYGRQQPAQYPQPGYAPPGYASPAYPPSPQAQPYAAPAAEKPARLPKPKGPAARRATTGLVLGVIGVIGGIFFGWTLLLSVAAIILGFLARSREPHARGVALGAIVTGFVGVLLSVGWLAYSILTWLALTAS